MQRRTLGRALRAAIAPLAPPLCAGCGAWAGRVEPLCPSCRRELRHLGGAIARVEGIEVLAAVAYDGPARALVSALKFRGVLPAAGVMGAQIAAGAPDALLAGAVLVPVPLHPARLARRGFNQAALIAAELARRRGLGLADCLARTGPPVTQVGRDREQRLRGPAGSIALVRGRRAPPRAVVVDDVITTGATAAACARALAAGGSRQVAAVAYARTLGR